MNYGISILFRAIPLLMALFLFRLRSLCARHGDGHEPIRCGARGLLFRNDIALFATAGTIIRQIIHTYSTAAKYALPIIGYLAAVVCFIGGMTYIKTAVRWPISLRDMSSAE